MATWYPLPGSLRGPKGDKGDPGDPAPGGSYMAGTVPGGSATVAITHNLGTRDVVVMVRDAATYAYVPVANDAPDENTVRLTFTETPAAGQYRYVLFAALGDEVQGPVAPTAHAPTHATGGTDPLSPTAIGAAEADHSHSGYAPAEHGHSGYAAEGHSHPGYAPAEHDHDADDITSGTLAYARLPAALRGPWVQTSGFAGSALAYLGNGRDTGGRLTVPALGYDWMVFAAGQYAARSDVPDHAPSLELTVGSPDGRSVGRGFALAAGRNLGWRPVPLSPVLGVVLSGSQSHTFYLWMRPLSGGGWVESSTEGSPHITVYALPMG